jgi:hypothetical protein
VTGRVSFFMLGGLWGVFEGESGGKSVSEFKGGGLELSIFSVAEELLLECSEAEGFLSRKSDNSSKVTSSLLVDSGLYGGIVPSPPLFCIGSKIELAEELHALFAVPEAVSKVVSLESRSLTRCCHGL